jgi:hypothetical protein
VGGSLAVVEGGSLAVGVHRSRLGVVGEGLRSLVLEDKESEMEKARRRGVVVEGTVVGLGAGSGLGEGLRRRSNRLLTC